MNSSPRIILASTSVYRRELLARLQLPFDCVASAIDESLCDITRPVERARTLARFKAQDVSARFPDAFVIGSDQVCSVLRASATDSPAAARILHKPGSTASQQSQLTSLSGHEVCFDTAVCLCRDGQVVGELNVPTRVRFRALSAREITDYVAQEPAADCAGGFKVEGLGISLFEWIRSDDPTALVGLPMIATARLLREGLAN